MGGIGNSNTESAGSTKAVVKGSDRRALDDNAATSAWRRASSGGPLRSELKRDYCRYVWTSFKPGEYGRASDSR